MIGLPADEGTALVQDLINIATASENVYTHRWQPFDLLIWDNKVTLHRSEGFDYQSLVHCRLLNRIVVAGTPASPVPHHADARA